MFSASSDLDQSAEVLTDRIGSASSWFAAWGYPPSEVDSLRPAPAGWLLLLPLQLPPSLLLLLLN